MSPAQRKVSARARQGGKLLNVVDTNVLVHDPNSIDSLREDGSKLGIPFVVIQELDGLKGRPDIGYDAREALRKIEDAQLSGDKSLIIIRNPSFQGLGDLQRNVADHQIIATARTIQQKRLFERVQLYSRDRPVRILGREVGIFADDYTHDQVTIPKYQLKELEISAGEIDFNRLSFPLEPYASLDIKENEGVLCKGYYSGQDQEDDASFAAIRKGERIQMIPDGINAFGLKPLSKNGDGENWAQQIAMMQLLDPNIRLVVLQGGPGCGKTLLALASAIHQRKLYKQIVVVRPMVPVEDEDRMGFLPGDKAEKMSPWFRPIHQALNFLKECDGTNKLIDGLLESAKIYFESLDYLRGMTFPADFLIVDDAQNLTPHQAKTIITRIGLDAKIVFTGDLGQIDRKKRLDEKSNGLAHTMATMIDNPLVGVTNFKETLRSPLASLAEERM